jgi:ABC-type multidrug transport system ATPase subunit
VSTALLVASDARIDAGGATLMDGLTFEASGGAVALVGDAAPLFLLFAGRAELRRGSVTVLGCPAERAIRENVLGVVPHELSFPPKWTTQEYLVESARLLGAGRRDAKRHAATAIERHGLGALAKRGLSTLGPLERRAVALAQATLGAPRVVALEAPFDGMPAALEAPLARLVERATAGSALVVSVLGPAATGAAAELTARADSAVVLRGSRVAGVGAPSRVLVPSRRYTVRAARSVTALAGALGARGVHAERVFAAGDAADSGRLVVRLPDGATTEMIVDAALAVEAPLLELVPAGLEA